MAREIHLCIIWERARHAQAEIIRRLNSQFHILAGYEVTWESDEFSENLSRFYGKKLLSDSDKQIHCGSGPFLLIVFEDASPAYAERNTLAGTAFVNTRVFEFKTEFRASVWGGLPIHATNDLHETRHDLYLLLGSSLDEFASTHGQIHWDGMWSPVRRGLTGHSGWKDLRELFFALGETCRYAVLRNFETLPAHAHGSHGDIDVLSSDESAALVANGRKIYNGEHRVHYAVMVGEEEVLFDFRMVGDGYYCENFERDIIERRVQDERGFFKPCSEDFHFALLYHALLHKSSLSNDYVERLTALGTPAHGAHLLPALQALDNFIAFHGYEYTRPRDPTVYFNRLAFHAYFEALHLNAPGDENAVLCKLALSMEAVDSEGNSDEKLQYHLSSDRCNVLRPFAEIFRGKVLEVGSGTGVVSAWLASLPGVQLTALEPSARLLRVMRYRCGHLENVNIIHGAVDDLDVDHFDVVVLLDQAKTAARFVGRLKDDESPIARLLMDLSGRISTAGQLIIADENALSLGRSLGFQSPVCLTNLPGSEPLGRLQIVQGLKAANFEVVQWLYPYPDHRRTRSIVTDQALSAEMDILPLIWQSLDGRPHGAPPPMESSINACKRMLGNGALPLLANSFVVVAGLRNLRPPVADLAFHYSTKRRDAFAKVVRFSQTVDGKITVNGRRLIPSAPPVAGGLTLVEYDEPYYLGTHWHMELVRGLQQPGWNFAFIEKWATRWFSAFLGHVALNRSDITIHTKVSGRFFDAIGRNLIFTQDGAAVFFDQEWGLDEEIPLGYMLFRGVFVSLMSVQNVSEPYPETPINAIGIFSYLCSHWGLPVDRQFIDQCVLQEQKLQHACSGWWWDDLSRVDSFNLQVAPNLVEDRSREIFWGPLSSPLPESPQPSETSTPKGAFSAVVRAIAFHLPQFHAIPENDEWWGPGFTEWNNVREGRPLFEGHDQPRVPAEMGYYDLSDVQVLERQARLAREHGLEGFCFYYYWFDGKRLLEKPVDQLLRHPEIDLPFCLCWANENWTRRWDGGEQQVLMQQTYSIELDEQFAMDLLPYVRDARYIRVNGMPLLLVYRLDIIPDVARAVRVWREVWRREGVGEVYLVVVESFRACDPIANGFDATCEFLPHQVNLVDFVPQMPLKQLRHGRMSIADYGRLADFWVDRPRPSYKRFRGIVPAWDNAARRRKGGAVVLHGSTPGLYERWLRRTVARTLEEFDGDERLVFINAWNEWGEGCYLEPDARFGRAYLEATRRVLYAPEAALREQDRQERAQGGGVPDLFARWLDSRDQEGARARMAASAGGASQNSLHVLVIGEHGSVEQTTRRSLQTAAGLPLPGVTISTIPAGADLAHRVNALISEHPHVWWTLVPAGCQFLAAGMEVALQVFAGQPDLWAAYGDEVVRAADGTLRPVFRPDFNLDLLVSHPGAMARHWWFHREAILSIGGFSAEDGSAFEFGALLRFAETGEFSRLGHIPEPMLVGPAVVTAGPDAQAALAAHLLRRGYAQAQVASGAYNTLRIHYGHGQAPLVSIIIPTRDQLPLLQRCVETLVDKTAYRHFELLIVDNDSRTQEARDWLEGLERLGSDQVRVLRYPHAFNYSAMNNLAAGHARGEYLLLLNNDTAVLQEEWLDEMLNHALRPEVGVVGAKLLYPDGSVQHAGVILGLNGPADHPYNGEALTAPGHMHRLQVDQGLSAVTGACLMIRKSLYEAVGGLDEEAFKVSYNDIDLCLKVRQTGHLVVWTPHALMMHVGSVSQNASDPAALASRQTRFQSEQDAMYAKWLPLLAHDPAYHRHFVLHGAGFKVDSELALPPKGQGSGLRVLARAADAWGSGHYRLIEPLGALREAGEVHGAWTLGAPTLAAVARFDPDVIVLQRQITEEQLTAMRQMRAFSRAFKVYELDDYLPNLPLDSAHRAGVPKDVLKILRNGLGMVDRLVVATEALAEAFSGLHRDIRVAENYLPVRWWSALTPPRRGAGVKPRVGWAGGASHEGDLSVIADVVRELSSEVEWVFMGMCPEALLPYVHEFHFGVPIEQYPQRLASLNLDLAIAPLDDNQFNACKSPLKLLEYGACGYPVVCSDIGPYRHSALPVTRVRNRFKDWVSAIRMHTHDLAAAAQAGDALRATVLRTGLLQGDAVKKWLKAWTP